MKSIASDLTITFNESSFPILSLTLTSHHRPELDEIRQVIAGGKLLSVEVKKHRKKRSLDANSYAWVLISKMADVLRTSKDEIYIKMLIKYGQREPQLLSVISEGAEMVYRATNNHCVEVGESELNGKVFKHLAILIGSSQFDSLQMSILVDGIVSECRDLNIETMTRAELELLKSGWKK